MTDENKPNPELIFILIFAFVYQTSFIYSKTCQVIKPCVIFYAVMQVFVLFLPFPGGGGGGGGRWWQVVIHKCKLVKNFEKMCYNINI